jgi:hypothetical protein
MRLDLFHAYAKHETDKKFLRVGHFSNELTSLRSYFQEHNNPHIDWERMFGERGLIYPKYRVMSRATDGKLARATIDEDGHDWSAEAQHDEARRAARPVRSRQFASFGRNDPRRIVSGCWDRRTR